VSERKRGGGRGKGHLHRLELVVSSFSRSARQPVLARRGGGEKGKKEKKYRRKEEKRVGPPLPLHLSLTHASPAIMRLEKAGRKGEGRKVSA